MRKAIGMAVALLVVVSRVSAGEHPEHPKSKAPEAAAEKAASAGALDGKVFVGEIGKAGSQKGDKDELVFKKGQFVSTACVAFGFNEAKYVATDEGGALKFTSEAVNGGSEKMMWTGVVKNDTLEATAVHQTAEGKTEYWFKGTLSAEKSQPKQEHPKKKAEHPEHPK